MSDNRLNRGQPDRSKINMSEDYEVKYWIPRVEKRLLRYTSLRPASEYFQKGTGSGS